MNLPGASQPVCHALLALILANIGSISRDRITQRGPFLEYGRCLHSTYLRKEVRMAGPPSNPPHPRLSLRTHPRKPLRMSSRGLSVHLCLVCDVHSKHWSVGAGAASSATEIVGSECPSPTQHPRRACAHQVLVPLSRKETPKPPHGLALRNGSPAWIHLGDVMQTQSHRCILALGSQQFRTKPLTLRTNPRPHPQPKR